MTTISYVHHASPGDHFTPQAFDDMIGKEVPVKLGDDSLGNGQVTNAKVAADGGTATISIELPTGTTDLLDQMRGNTAFSVNLLSTAEPDSRLS